MDNRTGSIFKFEALLSLAALIQMLSKFCSNITGHFSGELEAGLDAYKFFMLIVTCLSFLILLMHGSYINRNNIFLWYGVCYCLVGILSTFFSGMYSSFSLVFVFVRMSYWLFLMSISYYAVIHLNTVKYHTMITAAFVPILFTSLFILRRTEAGSGGMLLVNPIFYLTFLIPAVLLLRSNMVKFFLIMLIFIAVLLSFKRSALLSFVMSIPVYLYAVTSNEPNSKLKKLVPTVFLGCILLVLLFFTYKNISSALNLDWTGRIENIATDRGSGRLDIWSNYRNLMSQQSLFYWFMGNGFDATHYTPYGWAHNDILEILFDFGLLGFTFYLLVVFQLIKFFFEMKKYKYRHFPAYAVSLVIFFCGTMLSMLITMPQWFFGITFFWGCVIADFQNGKNNGDPERIGNPLYTYNYEDDNADDFDE